MVSEISGFSGKVEPLSTRMSRVILAGLLLAGTLLAALGLQRWVGQATVYAPVQEQARGSTPRLSTIARRTGAPGRASALATPTPESRPYGWPKSSSGPVASGCRRST